MVDNSGSLVIRARMRAVKAAIMSMLADHYVRKDSVAVMTFNEEFVGMLLPPTRSVGGVKKVVDDIPTGKKTPLSEALSFMHQYVGQYLRKHPSDVAFVILMTDAGANLALTEGNDPLEESIEIASHLRLDRMDCVLVDTKVSNEPNEKALRLSYALEAPYYKLEDLRSSDNIL
jgi:magnesium chelatase subunit D